MNAEPQFVECAEAAAFLRQQDRFLIVTHKNPDGDTVGCSGALCSALRRAGKEAFLYCNPQFTEKYLPFIRAYFAPEGYEPGCVVSTDVSASDMFAKGFDGPVDLCFDHHPTNPGIARLNCIRPEKASCSQLVLEVIEAMHGSATKAEAELLYIGVSTDTGCFQYSNTDADAHLAAARLISYGAEIYPLNEMLFRKVRSSRLQLEGLIFKGMQCFRNGEIVIATVTRDMIAATGVTEDDMDDLASLPGRINTQQIGVTIKELPDGSCKLSVRTNPHRYSSSRLCREFGGGGHEAAAGCTITADPLKARDLFLAAVDRLYPAE